MSKPYVFRIFTNLKKLKKSVDFFRKKDIIISVVKTLRNCVRVARQTLTLFVWVQILVPQP